MKRLLLALALIASGANASRHRSVAMEKVTVTSKPLLCAGFCPGFELIVSANGQLERHVESSRQPVRLSHISSRQYAAFIQALAPVRAAAKAVSLCVKTDSSQYDLQWSGGASPAHLRFCSGDSSAVEATRQALRVLGVALDDGYFVDEVDSPSALMCRGMRTPGCERR
jgi:hypothetical protein